MEYPGAHQPDPEEPANTGEVHSEKLAHTPVAARVPERVARGVLCSGQVVLDSPKEFVVDFLQGLTKPAQVVARVVLAPSTFNELSAALRQNLDLFARNFGPPAPLPTPNNARRPTIQEIYENFRLPDDMFSGTYANSVVITHSPTDFAFDFITGFYPTASVSARVFMPAQQVPRFLQTLDSAYKTWQSRMQNG